MNNNVIKLTTNSAGTGTINISPPSYISYGPVDYSLYSLPQWERGLGLYHSGKLYRSQVLSSTNGNQRISLSGTSDVIFLPALRNIVYTNTGIPISGNTLFYDGLYWSSRNLSSGDIVAALGYSPGTGSGGGSGISLPINISDVTNLQSSLDGKSSTSHSHGNITSAGAVGSTANLPLITTTGGTVTTGSFGTTANTFCQGNDSRLSDARTPTPHTHPVSDIIGSGLGGSSNGNLNVVDYNVSTTGNPLQNTLNLQKAIEAGLYISKKSQNQNGCLVEFPNTSSGVIGLEWPVYTNGDNVEIRGQGKQGTTLVTFGPAFVVGHHPRKYTVLYNHFEDKFAWSGTLTNGSSSVSSFTKASRVRIGSCVSGVGIPAETLVTGVNSATNTILLNKNATSSATSNLFFYADSFFTSGIITNNSAIISGISSSGISRMDYGAVISGVGIQNNSYVLWKIPESGMVLINKVATANNTINLGINNWTNTKLITITGVATSGSSLVSASSGDLGRIGAGNKIFAPSLQSDLTAMKTLHDSTDFNVLKINSGNLEVSSPALSNYTGVFVVTNGWFDVKNYWEDIREFAAGGLFPPVSGSAFAYTPNFEGQYKAVRTRGSVAQYRSPLNNLATGDPRTTFVPWSLLDEVLWEFRVYHHSINTTYNDYRLTGGIAGAGSTSGPDPWFLSGGQDGNGTPLYLFHLAVTDSGRINNSVIEVKIPQNTTQGLHRISIQYDRVAKTITAWVDYKQVAIEMRDYTGSANGFVPLIGTPLQTQDRIAGWKFSDLVIGGSSSNLATGGSTRESDYSILCVACYKKKKYQVNGTGTDQLKINGTAADDSFAYFDPNFTNTSDSDIIGWATFGTSDNDVNNCEINIHARTYTKDGVAQWGFLLPRGEGNHGTNGAVSNTYIKGFYIQKRDGSPLSCAIYETPFLYLRIKDIRTLGFAATIGSAETVTSYDAYYEDMDLGSMLHLIHQIAYIKEVKLPYPRWSAIRTAGTQVHLKNFLCPSPTLNSDGFWSDFAGGSIGAGLMIEDGTINWEDFHIYPSLYGIYSQKRADHGGNYFIAKNVVWGTYAVPVIILDDLYPQSRVDSYVSMENSPFPGNSPCLIVRGGDWTGRVNVNYASYFDDVITHLPSINTTLQPHNPRVITVDSTYYGPPVGSAGFIGDCHEILINKPAIGGASRLICKTDNVTGISREGTSKPPNWVVDGVVTGSGQHSAAFNSFNTMYCEADLAWPSGSTTTLKSTMFQFDYADHILAHVLTGRTPSNRSKSLLTWGYGLANPMRSTNAYAGGTFFYSDFLINKDVFSVATDAYRENKTSIVMNGDNVPGWSVSLNSQALFGLHAGTDFTNTTGLFMGKTVSIPSGFWKITAANTVTLPSGAVRIKYVPRDGGWTRFGVTKIMNYLLDSSTDASASPSGASFPSTMYLGLSRTYVTSSGTNLTEVSGASYARIPIPMNTGVWGRIHDRKELWGNISGMSYSSPTEDWGLIRSAFISDSPSGGNIYHTARLTVPLRVFSGDDPVRFHKYAIQFQL